MRTELEKLNKSSTLTRKEGGANIYGVYKSYASCFPYIYLIFSSHQSGDYRTDKKTEVPRD